jgi:hypothetical protein
MPRLGQENPVAALAVLPVQMVLAERAPDRVSTLDPWQEQALPLPLRLPLLPLPLLPLQLVIDCF